jgi:8-oxo-dGTP diphosphatase
LRPFKFELEIAKAPSVEHWQRSRLLEMAIKRGIERLVVGAVIADTAYRVLLLRRAATDTYPDLWELPSGGVDTGEDLASAFKREVFEETGLAAEIGGFINSFDYTTGSGARARQFVFHCEQATGHVMLNPAEHDDFKWASLAALPDVSREIAAILEQWSKTAATFDRINRYEPPSTE